MEKKEPLFITYDMALEGLQKAVVAKGEEYIYERQADKDTGDEECMYFAPDAQPSCIVGYVLDYYGVKIKYEDETNQSSIAGIWQSGIIAFPGLTNPDLNQLYHDKDLLSNQTYQLLSKAQDLQDHGLPWGVTVEQAAADTEVQDAGQ